MTYQDFIDWLVEYLKSCELLEEKPSYTLEEIQELIYELIS